MTKSIVSPRALGRRESFLLAGILSAMALSACMTSQEKIRREDALARLKAEQVARIERAQEQERQEREEKKAADEAALQKWVKENEPYVRGLCASESGAEHRFAWDSWRIAVSTDKHHASEAEKFRRPIIDCEQFRIPKPAAFNAAAFMESLKAEHIKRDEWLASRTGKEYQQHLCSLSGDERQKALAAAAQLHGIIPRENVTDEKTAREHGFAILDCAKDKTSAVGYTWSNIALAPFGGLLS